MGEENFTGDLEIMDRSIYVVYYSNGGVYKLHSHMKLTEIIILNRDLKYIDI